MFCWYNQNESKKGFSQFHLLWIAKLSENNVIRMSKTSLYSIKEIPNYHSLYTTKLISKTDRESSMNFVPNFDQPTKMNL